MISNRSTTQNLTLTAIFLAMNILLSSFALPVPGGKFYLNDAAIMLAALILSPRYAFIVGGVGAFLGDIFFYPVTMFISLVVHGLQAYVMSYIIHSYKGLHLERVAIGAFLIGEVISVTGYSLAKIFIYSTLAYALMKLPYEGIQAVVCTALAIALAFHTRLDKYFVEK